MNAKELTAYFKSKGLVLDPQAAGMLAHYDCPEYEADEIISFWLEQSKKIGGNIIVQWMLNNSKRICKEEGILKGDSK